MRSLAVAALLAACAGSGDSELVSAKPPEPVEPQPDFDSELEPDAPEPPRPPYVSDRRRLEALGQLTSLDEVARALYAPGDFTPLEKPRPGDWLDAHPETGQTFEQFARARYLRPDAKRHTLYLLPLGYPGTADDPDPEIIVQFARSYFQIPVKLMPAASPSAMKITTRKEDGPRQLLATDILAELAGWVPDDGFLLIALTGEDLYPAPDWSFVFGQATLRDRVAVYSTARYQPRFYGAPEGMPNIRETILSRTLKVMSHEVGHMFGLEHCVHYRCVMNGSNSILETDRSPHHLCPVCLRKLATSARFDLVGRYQSLGAIYQKLGMAAEADWINGRIERNEHLRGRWRRSPRTQSFL